MRIEPFEPFHLIGARVHPKQERHRALLDSEIITNAGTSWSALFDDELVAVGGLMPIDGGAAAWLLFTDRITPGRFVALYRTLARSLARLMDSGVAVLVHIDPDYPEAARLADKLGFTEDGEDCLDDGRRMIRMVADVTRVL